MGQSAGLCGNCHVDHGLFCSECVLWVLLRAASAAEVLEYGKQRLFPTTQNPAMRRHSGHESVPVNFKFLGLTFLQRVCLSTDLSRWPGLHSRLHQPQIPHAQLAALPSGHVRGHGSQRRISRTARHLHVRSGSDARFDRAFLAGTARISVCVRSGTLCGKSPRTLRSQFSPMFPYDKVLTLGPAQARTPEKWNPGYFDVWGSSHQIFHVLILLAAMAHLIGLLTAFHYRHEQPTCQVS